MKKIITDFFKNNWVEILIEPPLITILCYFIYGKVFLESWSNFWQATLPWILPAIVVPIGCKWVRRKMHSQYPKLEDWWKRVIFSITGYLSFNLLSCLNFYILIHYPYTTLRPNASHFIWLVVAIVTFVVLATVLYEGITFFGKWKEAIIETDQLEQLNFEGQYRSLQSQLNPHFLFNSFNVLSSLIAENPARAERFVDELSNVYRYLLRASGQETATVCDELRFARSFFHLLETRHEHSIKLDIRVHEAFLNRCLPTHAMQILLENAVKHNETSPEKPLLIEIL